MPDFLFMQMESQLSCTSGENSRQINREATASVQRKTYSLFL